MDAEKNHLALRLFVISSSWESRSYKAVILSFSVCFFMVCNLLRLVHCLIASVCVFVDLAMPHAYKSCLFQSQPEQADSRKKI